MERGSGVSGPLPHAAFAHAMISAVLLPALRIRRTASGIIFPKGSIQLTRERHYEIEDSLSYLGVAHGGESAAQLKAFAHEVGDFGFAVWPERNCSCRRSGASIREEVAGRDAEKIGKLLQATGADPIHPILVLLDLLPADTERLVTSRRLISKVSRRICRRAPTCASMGFSVFIGRGE